MLDQPLRLFLVVLAPLTILCCSIIAGTSARINASHPHFITSLNGVETENQLGLLQEALVLDSTNLDLHFTALSALPELNDWAREAFEFTLAGEKLSLSDHYHRWAASDDPVKREIGAIGGAYLAYQEGMNSAALRALDMEGSPMFSLYKGYLFESYNSFRKKEIMHLYFHGMADPKYSAWAKDQLFSYLYSRDDVAELDAIIEVLGPTSFSASYRTTHYLEEGRYGRYLIANTQLFFDGISLQNGISITLIFLLWLAFLRNIFTPEPMSIKRVVGMVFAGLAVMTITYMLYDLVNSWLPYHTKETDLYTFLYCITTIGPIEEFTKLLPFLVMLLFFRKHLKSPLSYLQFAMLSALLFATFENINYSTSGDENVIFTRGVVTSMIHMAFSAIAVYGFILHRFRRKSWVFIPLLLLLAVAAHGIYDHWLFLETEKPYYLISALILAMLAMIFVVIYTNAINFSTNFQAAQSTRFYRSGSYLMLGFVIAFIAMFAYLAYTVGHAIAFRRMVVQAYWILPFVPFLGWRLGSLRLEKGRWDQLSLLAPVWVARLDRLQKAKTTFVPYPSTMAGAIPFSGTLQLHPLLSAHKEQFLIKLDKPLTLGQFSCTFVIIQAWIPHRPYRDHEKFVVQMRGLPDRWAAQYQQGSIHSFPLMGWFWCEIENHKT